MGKKTKLDWKQHKANWKNCELCDLCLSRCNVVLLRGSIPAPVLFIGEAPGYSEDVTGTPFSKGAPAGSLLEEIIHRAGLSKGDFAVTNLIGCIPKSSKENSVTEPPKESIRACRERLLECLELVSPQLLIAVGVVAEKWLTEKHLGKWATLPTVSIIHPAAIRRMHVAQQGLVIQTMVVKVKEGLEDLRDS